MRIPIPSDPHEGERFPDPGMLSLAKVEAVSSPFSVRQTIAVGVEARADACRAKPIDKGVVFIGKKFYRTPMSFNYKETELSENLNDGMEWVFRDHGIS